MSFKIAFIGAGSLVFARTLFTDILSVPEFHDIEIAFTDINPENLERTRQLCQRDLDANEIPITIQASSSSSGIGLPKCQIYYQLCAYRRTGRI